jgi:cytochrome b561
VRTTIVSFLLVLTAANVFALAGDSLRSAVLPQQSAAPDTIHNPALEQMLSQYKQRPDATDLPYDSWTFDVHRYLGYTILAATVAQIVLGSMTWDARKAGEEPSTKTAHKYLGYTTAGLSLAQTSLGYVNFWKLRGKQSGNNKRLFHLGLSTVATAGFVTAAAIAYNARREIDDGTAAAEGDTFDDLYSNHRTAGIISGVSVLLTVIVIEW